MLQNTELQIKSENFPPVTAPELGDFALSTAGIFEGASVTSSQLGSISPERKQECVDKYNDSFNGILEVVLKDLSYDELIDLPRKINGLIFGGYLEYNGMGIKQFRVTALESSTGEYVPLIFSITIKSLEVLRKSKKAFTYLDSNSRSAKNRVDKTKKRLKNQNEPLVINVCIYPINPEPTSESSLKITGSNGQEYFIDDNQRSEYEFDRNLVAGLYDSSHKLEDLISKDPALDTKLILQITKIFEAIQQSTHV